MSGERILFVDDEPNILAGLKRQLRNKFEYDCAVGPAEAMELIKKRTEYAVIVSDMRMPGVDGVEFLASTKSFLPHAVNILLTGNADQGTAVKAINEGSIFRFISKPCEIETLEPILRQAIVQHQLITSEKELIQKTLGGAVKLLTDLMNLLDPHTTSRSIKVREFAKKVLPALGIKNSWEVELAIMLGEIGMSLLPAELVVKVKSNQQLTEAERTLVKKVPETSATLIRHIPRLEGVAETILYSTKNVDGTGFPADDVAWESIPKGARLIKILKAAESTSAGLQLKTFKEFRFKTQIYDPALLDLLIAYLENTNQVESSTDGKVEIKLRQLTVGQKVLKDILLSDGRLLLKKGTLLTDATVQKVRNYASLVGIQEPLEVDVLIPSTMIEVR